MAKTIKKEDINEKEIIASFLQDVPVDHESLVSANNENFGEPPASKKETPKDEPRRRRSKEQDYETLFVRESSITARTGKMVYIRRDFHDTIQTICRVIGDNEVSLSGYIDNILVHHFETFGGEITRLYNEKHKGINIIKDLEK
jgi:hypothetical protein